MLLTSTVSSDNQALCTAHATIVYYNAHVPAEANHARDLHERIRREFPEARFIILDYIVLPSLSCESISFGTDQLVSLCQL